MASPKPKGKQEPKPNHDDAQSERFKAMAQVLGADQTGVGFEAAFRAIAPPKRIPKRKAKTKTPAK